MFSRGHSKGFGIRQVESADPLCTGGTYAHTHTHGLRALKDVRLVPVLYGVVAVLLVEQTGKIGMLFQFFALTGSSIGVRGLAGVTTPSILPRGYRMSGVNIKGGDILRFLSNINLPAGNHASESAIVHELSRRCSSSRWYA